MPAEPGAWSAATMHAHSPSTPDNPLQTKVTGIAAVAGPLLLLASTAAHAATGDGLNDGELGGAIQVWAFIGLGIAIVGLARRVESPAPRAAVALTVLGIVTTAGGVAYGLDSVQAAVFTETLHETDSAAVPFALMLPGIMTPVTLITLGLVLARTGVASRPLSWLLVAGGVLFPLSRIPDVIQLALLCDLLLLVSLGGIGLGLLAGRSPATATAPASPAVAA